MITLTIPRPPSLNELWSTIIVRPRGQRRPVVRRIRSKKYNEWNQVAGWEVRRQMVGIRTIECRYNMELFVPISRRDTGNWEKAISDLLQTLKVVSNDGNVHQIVITPVKRDKDSVAVVLTPLPDMDGVRQWVS